MAATFPPYPPGVTAFLSCALMSRCLSALVPIKRAEIPFSFQTQMALENFERTSEPPSANPTGTFHVAPSSVTMNAMIPATVAMKEPLTEQMGLSPVSMVDGGYVKKKIFVEKYEVPKKKQAQYADIKLKFKDGHWEIKQASRKLKI